MGASCCHQLDCGFSKCGAKQSHYGPLCIATGEKVSGPSGGVVHVDRKWVASELTGASCWKQNKVTLCDLETAVLPSDMVTHIDW